VLDSLRSRLGLRPRLGASSPAAPTPAVAGEQDRNTGGMRLIGGMSA
jgi:hypothetical protein